MPIPNAVPTMGYWIIRACARLLLSLFFKLSVEGLEHIPRKSNFLIVANHPSYLDPLLVQAVIPCKIHCLVLRRLYRSVAMRVFLRLEETIPIGRVSDRAFILLSAGKVVGMFPEGGRSRPDGALREFRRGAAVLAFKTGRPVLPCAILGAHHAFPRGARFPRPCPVKVKIGKPIFLPKQFDATVDELSLMNGMFAIKKQIQEMIDAG